LSVSEALWKELLVEATRPYRKAGLFAYHFAQGKLGSDPVFRAILEQGLLAGRQHLLDLGCGQGLLAALLLAAARCHERGSWPQAWPAPPQPQSIRGIELRQPEVRRAQRALGGRCGVTQGDILSAALGSADAVVVLDVLHYLPAERQPETLHRIRASLPTGGRLLLRVGDAAGGVRFRITRWTDKVILLGRGHGMLTTHCRTLPEWREVLTQCGFDSTPAWMSRGTPFANVLLIAHAR
jgi:SAM-dependent methyltransferase